MEKEKKDVIVFNADIAKKLLRKRYCIVDLKKDKQDPDGKKTIFVFRNDDGLEEEIKKLVNERRNRGIQNNKIIKNIP